MYFRKLFFFIAFSSFTLISLSQEATEKANELFESFVTSQNEHDLTTLDKLFFQSPDFLWINKGTEIWGNAETIEALEKLHKANLRLEPVSEKMKIILLTDQSAQIFVPVVYITKEAGRDVKRNYLLNLTVASKNNEWKIYSVVTVLAGTK